jgi:hypothetical protein
MSIVSNLVIVGLMLTPTNETRYSSQLPDLTTIQVLTELTHMANSVLDLVNASHSDSPAYRAEVVQKLDKLLAGQYRMEQRLARIESELQALGIQVGELHKKEEYRELLAICNVVEERYKGWISRIEDKDVVDEIRGFHNRLSVARARYIMFDPRASRIGASEFLTVAYAFAVELAFWDLLKTPDVTRRAVLAKYAAYFRDCADTKINGSVGNLLLSLRNRHANALSVGRSYYNHLEAKVRVLWHWVEVIDGERRTYYRYHRKESIYHIYASGSILNGYNVWHQLATENGAATSDGDEAFRDRKVQEAINNAQQKYDGAIREYKYCEDRLPVAISAMETLRRLTLICDPPPLHKLVRVVVTDKGPLGGLFYLDWESIDGASYEVQWSTVSDFSVIVGSVILNDRSKYVMSGMAPGTQYWVRVRPIRGNQTAEWSDPVSFVGKVEAKMGNLARIEFRLVS